MEGKAKAYVKGVVLQTLTGRNMFKGAVKSSELIEMQF